MTYVTGILIALIAKSVIHATFVKVRDTAKEQSAFEPFMTTSILALAGATIMTDVSNTLQDTMHEPHDCLVDLDFSTALSRCAMRRFRDPCCVLLLQNLKLGGTLRILICCGIPD